MITHTRISRRDFFKLNGLIGGAAAAALLPTMAPTIAQAARKPTSPSATAQTAPPIQDLDWRTLPVRYGTPTDLARTLQGQIWSVDRDGVIHQFDEQLGVWRADASEADFPSGSQLVLARWGRPSGPNQMLMVLHREALS